MNRSSFLAVVTEPLRAVFPEKSDQAKIDEVRRELEIEASRLAQADGEQEGRQTPA